jgi:hypothetical protein
VVRTAPMLETWSTSLPYGLTSAGAIILLGCRQWFIWYWYVRDFPWWWYNLASDAVLPAATPHMHSQYGTSRRRHAIMAHTIQLIAANRYLPCQYTVKRSLHQLRRPTMSGIVFFLNLVRELSMVRIGTRRFICMGNHSCVVFASHQELWVLGAAANAREFSSSGRGTATVTIYALDWIQFVEKLYSQTLTQPRCPVPWRMLCTRHNLSGYYIPRLFSPHCPTFG